MSTCRPRPAYRPRQATARKATIEECRLLAEAAANAQASRDRRRAARLAQEQARAELQRELETPLVARPKR